MISPLVELLRTKGRRARISSSEIRKDYLQERYVLIAPRRNKRPHPVSERHEEHDARCVFCPERLKRSEIIETYPKGKRAWRVAAVKNLYPAVSTSFGSAYGRQEIVIETPAHEVELQDLPGAHVAELLAVYGDRIRAIKRDRRIEYTIIFKNYGGASGATLSHAHSQILGTAFVPPHIADKTAAEDSYRARFRRCPYCDIIREESKGPRRIYADRYVVAFAPYASFHSYEAVIMPRRHVDNVSELDGRERAAMATLMKRILTAVLGLNVPYNFYFHELVRDRDQHLYMKITPRGALWAGVEIGTGLIINPVPPEDAARFYRERL